MFLIENPRKRFVDTLKDQKSLYGGVYRKEGEPVDFGNETDENDDDDPWPHDTGHEADTGIAYWFTILGGPYAGTYKLYKKVGFGVVYPRIAYHPNVTETVFQPIKYVNVYNQDEATVLQSLQPYVDLVVESLLALPDDIRAVSALDCFRTHKDDQRKPEPRPSWALAIEQLGNKEQSHPPEHAPEYGEVESDDFGEQYHQHLEQQAKERRRLEHIKEIRRKHYSLVKAYNESQKSNKLKSLSRLAVGQIAQFLLLLQGWSGIPFAEVQSILRSDPAKIFDILPLDTATRAPSEWVECIGAFLYSVKFNYKERKTFARSVLLNRSIVAGYNKIFSTEMDVPSILREGQKQNLSGSEIRELTRMGLNLNNLRNPAWMRHGRIKELLNRFHQHGTAKIKAVRYVNFIYESDDKNPHAVNQMKELLLNTQNAKPYPGNLFTGVPPCKEGWPSTPEGKEFLGSVERNNFEDAMYWFLQLFAFRRVADSHQQFQWGPNSIKGHQFLPY